MGLLPPATLVDQTARRAGGVEQATTLQACSKGRYSVEIKSQLKPGIGSLRFTGNKQQYLYFFIFHNLTRFLRYPKKQSPGIHFIETEQEYLKL